MFVSKSFFFVFVITIFVCVNVDVGVGRRSPHQRRYSFNDYDETYVFGLSDDDRRSFLHFTQKPTTKPNIDHVTIGKALKKSTDISKTLLTAKTEDGNFELDPPYTYIGCFDAWFNRNISSEQPDWNTQYTPEMCAAFCKAQPGDYDLALLKGIQCVCARTRTFEMARVPDFYCTLGCPLGVGDGALPNNSCGGNFVFSVYCMPGSSNCSHIRPFYPLDLYQTTVPPPVQEQEDHLFIPITIQDDEGGGNSNEEVVNGMYYACAECTSPAHCDRQITPVYDYLPKNSPENCRDYCGRPVKYNNQGSPSVREKTKFAILTAKTIAMNQRISICFCTNDVTTLNETDSEICSVPCPGDPTRMCGGPLKNVTVYCVDLKTGCEKDDNMQTTILETTTPSPTSLPPTTTLDPFTGTMDDCADNDTRTHCPGSDENIETTLDTESPTTTTNITMSPTTDTPTTTTIPTTSTKSSTPSTSITPPTTTTTTTTTTTPPSLETTEKSDKICNLHCNKKDARGNYWTVCAGTVGKMACGSNSAEISWTCGEDGMFTTNQPDFSNCKTIWVGELEETLKDVNELNEAESFLAEVSAYCKEAEAAAGSDSDAKYFGHEIEGIMEMVRTTAEKANLKSQNTSQYEIIADKVLTISGTVLTFMQPWGELDQKTKSQTSNKLIGNIEKTILSLTSKVERGTAYQYRKTIGHSDVSVVGDVIFKSKSRRDEDSSYSFRSQFDDSCITLPPGWLHSFPSQRVHIVGMIIDSKFVRGTMPGQFNNLIGAIEGSEKGTKIINGKLMSLSVVNGDSSSTPGKRQSVRFKGKGVQITFQHDVEAWGDQPKEIKRKLHFGEEAKAVLATANCVYWDTQKLDWSSDGCVVSSSDRYRTTCDCEHLTSFAILMDAHNYVGKNLGLEILTLILCPLSIICLFITIVAFTIIRSVQNSRTTITKHLSVCLLVGISLILLVVDRNNFNMNDGFCMASGILSHYSFLCAFLWMAVEGWHLYKMVVHVFDSGNDYTTFYSICCYGFPLIIVIITVTTGHLLGHRPYGGDVYCWLDGGYIWSFMIPVAVIVAGNLIVLFITLKTAYQLQHTNNMMQARVRKYRTWLRGCFSVTILLGTTWMVGFFILTDATGGLVAAYIFTLLNASQGIFLFIFHCLYNEKIRAVAERTLPLPAWLSISHHDPTQSFMTKTAATKVRSFDSGFSASSSKNSELGYRISTKPNGPDIETQRVARCDSLNRRRGSLGTVSSSVDARRESDSDTMTDSSQNNLLQQKRSVRM